MASKILCIDAHGHTLSDTLQHIEQLGLPAIGVRSVQSAKKLMAIAQPRFILLALDLPQAEIQLCLNEHQNLPQIPMLALAKQSDSQSRINERKFGHYFSEILMYPLNDSDLAVILAEFAATD